MKVLASLMVPSGMHQPTSPRLVDLFAAASRAAQAGETAALVIVWHQSESIGEAARSAAADVLEARLASASTGH